MQLLDILVEQIANISDAETNVTITVYLAYFAICTLSVQVNERQVACSELSICALVVPSENVDCVAALAVSLLKSVF